MPSRPFPVLKTAAIIFFTVCFGAGWPATNQPTFAQKRKSVTFPVLADRIFENEKLINFFSIFTKEPEDASDIHRIPDTHQAGYIFPIDQIKRYRDPDGLIRLEGTIFIRGDASKTAIPLLNHFFSNPGDKSRPGTYYLVKIRFVAADASTTNAVDVNWLKKSDLNEYQDGNEKLVVGFTQLGSDSVKINPVYADAHSMRTAFSSWPINQKQLGDAIKHTRGVFAHEMLHTMGLSHMRNHTRSMASYSYGRYLTDADAQAICLLVTHGEGLLCPN